MFGIVEEPGVVPLLDRGDLRDVRPDGLEVCFDPGPHVVQLADTDRRDHLGPTGAAGGAVETPILRRERLEGQRLDVDRGIGVGDEEVAVDEHRVAPLVGEMERELGELHRLDHVHRRQHDVAVVAVPATTRRLEVVALTTRHVEDHHGQVRERSLGERLLHQRESLARGSGGRARAGGQRSPAHPHGLELALGVHAHAADLGQAFREVLEQLRERCHRVAGEEAAAGGDRRLGHRLRTLHEPATRCGGHCSSSIGSS